MNITSLKTYVYAVKYKSLSKAAEAMYLSQSAVSQQIKSLEFLLSIKLLERSHQGVVPTLLGNVVYQHAEKILSYYSQMSAEIENLQNDDKKIRIISTPVMYSYALPCLLYHIKEKYPNYNLIVDTMSSESIEDKILQGVSDIGFIVGKPKDKTLKVKKVFTDQVVLVASNDSDIPEKISCDDIYKYPLFMLSNACKTRGIISEYLKGIGINVERIKTLFDLNSTESMKMSILHGYGLAFVPYMGIKKELYNKQLRVVELENFSLENDYYLIRLGKDEHIDLKFLELISYIEKTFKETIC